MPAPIVSTFFEERKVNVIVERSLDVRQRTFGIFFANVPDDLGERWLLILLPSKRLIIRIIRTDGNVRDAHLQTAEAEAVSDKVQIGSTA